MSRISTFASAFALAASAIAAPAFAANQLADGGFETQAAGVVSYCYFVTPNPGGQCAAGAWTSAGGAGFQDENNSPWPGQPTGDGSKYGFVQLSGALSQDFTANDSGTFSLSWFDAGRPRDTWDGNQTYDVVLSSNLGSVNLGSFATTSFQPFTARSIASFGLTSGTAYTLTFQGTTSTGDHTAFIDAVALSSVGAAVPEPTSWALMILGFGGVGATLRSNRRRTAVAV